MVVYGTEKPQAYRPRLVDERLQIVWRFKRQETDSSAI